MAQIATRHVAHDAGAPTVEVDRVSVSYNGTPALEDVSFRTRPAMPLLTREPQEQ